MAAVPCDGCRECCINSVIFLYEQDLLQNYESQLALNPQTGFYGFRLKQKPNGECIYLDRNGCSIHNNAPRACKEFDCRTLFERTPRMQRKQASGQLKKVFMEGRARLDTLETVMADGVG